MEEPCQYCEATDGYDVLGTLIPYAAEAIAETEEVEAEEVEAEEEEAEAEEVVEEGLLDTAVDGIKAVADKVSDVI